MFIKHLLAITEQGTKKIPPKVSENLFAYPLFLKSAGGQQYSFLPKRQLGGLGLGWALEVPWGKGVDFFFFSLGKESNVLGPNAVTFKFQQGKGK